MKHLIFGILICIAAAGSPVALAAPCPQHLTIDNWIKAYEGDAHARQAMLAMLGKCVPGNKVLQQEVDDFSVDSLEDLQNRGPSERKALAGFISNALLINAKAGFASSQHNYAAIHNADPHGLLKKYIKQDIPTFVYWTRRAAAQKEPRALFNLAVRMASDNPTEGIKTDLPGAYIIFSYLAHTDTGLPGPVTAYAAKMQEKLKARLGTARTQQLDAKVASFDFAALAPHGAPPGAKHGK